MMQRIATSQGFFVRFPAILDRMIARIAGIG
jgi:hypothetical protein